MLEDKRMRTVTREHFRVTQGPIGLHERQYRDREMLGPIGLSHHHESLNGKEFILKYLSFLRFKKFYGQI